MKKALIFFMIILQVGCSTSNTWCPENEVRVAYDELQDLMYRWEDTMNIAYATPRMNLSPVIADLQEIKRDASKVPLPDCLLRAYSYLYDSMDDGINAFLEFMSEGSDDVIKDKINMSTWGMGFAADELAKINRCLPDCQREEIE